VAAEVGLPRGKIEQFPGYFRPPTEVLALRLAL
jgi:hypothetical protein